MEATGFTRVNNGFAYVYTKLAMNLEIVKLTKMYGEKHIRVNAVMPGDTATGLGGEDGNVVDPSKQSPFAGYAGRTADAKEMAMPFLFLNSDMASYVSGTYLFADYGACNSIMSTINPDPVGECIEANMTRR